MYIGAIDARDRVGSRAPCRARLPISLRWRLALATRPSPSADAALRSSPAGSSAEEDSSDVRASLDGDGEAFARLVRRYQAPIAAMMRRFTRNGAQWEELVQEVFVQAYFSLRGFRGTAPLLHWLRRIATRVGYRWWKDRSRRRAESGSAIPDLEQAPCSPGDAGSAAEAGEIVHAVLARMAPRDRLVLTLMYLEECSLEEISQLTGWSRAMVKVQAHRARKRLALLLREDHEHL